ASGGKKVGSLPVRIGLQPSQGQSIFRIKDVVALWYPIPRSTIYSMGLSLRLSVSDLLRPGLDDSPGVRLRTNHSLASANHDYGLMHCDSPVRVDCFRTCTVMVERIGSRYCGAPDCASDVDGCLA